MSSANDETQASESAGDETGGEAGVAAEVLEGRLELDVEIDDVGPCRKHVRVKIPRSDIEKFYDSAVEELASSATVPGFRVGHVPKKLVSRRFRKELTDDVKQKLLLGSLEQISEENDLDPIDEPNLDVENIEIPEEGDFEYEFEVEVRPEFDLPAYDGLKIERPVKTISDEDIEDYLEQYLAQYGKLVPVDGPAEAGDSIVASIEFQHDGEKLRELSEITLRLRSTLRFHDAELENFAELMAGAKPGDVRDAELTISSEAEAMEMRGEKVSAKITVQDVKRHEAPELDKEFLQRIGVDSADELREEVKNILERQVVYRQRQKTREQVLEKITSSADWDLPETLVSKQVDNALHREILEMQQAGFTTQQIQAHENELRQRSVSTTRQAMKEHFVLDKIATEENIEVTPADIDTEVRLMAMQRGESPRRLRARLNKTGVIENLEAQIRERKAVDVILGKAVYEDVEEPATASSDVEAIGQSVCKAMESVSAGSVDEEESTEESES